MRLQDQPKDLILEQLIYMDYNDFISMCSTSKTIRNICKTHENYIYTNRIKNEFFDKKPTMKFIYESFARLKKRNVFLYDKNQQYILFENAINSGDINKIQYLSDIIGINVENNEKWTPLMHALKYSTPEIQDKILNLGVNVNVENKDKWTPLMYALRYSTPYIQEKILNLGANANVKNNCGWTVLRFALEYSTQDILEKIHTRLIERN